MNKEFEIPKAFNAVSAEINPLGIAEHPGYKRLFGQAGFSLIDSSQLEEFLKIEGLKMLVFADDPNERKTTMDMAVIAPELKKAFSGTPAATAWAQI